MSRIQDILNKAERDGTARRTRSISDPAPIAQGPSVTAATPAVAVAVPVAPPLTSFEAPPPPAWTSPAATAATAIDPHEIVTVTPTLDASLVTATAPQSLAAEHYRLLRTRLKRAENGRAVRSILVTSPAKGDGKSLTAANLALVMAQEFHQRVLLVDADFRRPSIARLFGLSASPGLADVLLGAAELDDALKHLPEQRLTVLPAGTVPTHPGELLGSTVLRRVLDSLRGRFDRILIDMPPVAPVADVHVVAPMADGLLMIVRAGVTGKPDIERALSGLDATKVLGLVLNDAGESKRARTQYESYRYVAG
jgi:capsular exopolysaccharide synthesis family protein